MKPLDCRNSAISDKTCPPKGLLPIPKKSRTIKTDKPRPFLCPICTRGFSRQEHLKRHQRSHTNEKPFLCAFCGRCFARRDLVLRHQQKLCAALNDQEKRQQLVGKHIIRRPGNKETVLPTPQNPLAHVLAVENKKERAAGQRSLSAAPGHVPKVKVQGSLSAPTILTCFPERDDRNNVKTEFADTPLQSNVPSTREPLTRTAVTESGFSDVAGPPTSLSVLPYYEKSCDCMECPETSCGQAYATVLNPEYNGQATAQFTLNECFVNSGAYSPPNADVPQPLTYVPQPNPYYFSYKAPNFPIERTEQEDSLEPIGHMGPVDTAESTLSRNHDITEMANTLYMPVKQVANQKPMEYWGSYNLPLTSVPSSTFTPVVSTETSVTVSNQSFVNNTVPIFQNVPQAQQVSEDEVGRANSSTDFFTLSEKHDFNSFEKDPDEPLSGVMSGTKKLGGSRLSFFTPQLHDYIISDNNLEGIAFPTIAELDWYVSMYQNEFHGSLPFVHLHSIVPSVDVYPLLLAVAVIGALHRSHLQQAKLLYNVTRFRIWKLMAQPQCGGMPIWVAQALALLAFFGLFSGDRSVSGTLEADLATLVDIVKRYRLNIPFEAVCEPPVDAEGALEFQTAEHVERIYDYFLEAQSRIRTCHTVLMLTVVFTSITGRKGSFFSTDLQCGVPCFQEELFLTENYREWWRLLDKHHIVIDSKEALLYLSNGGQSYCECLSYLINGPTVYVAENKKTSFETMFSLLVSIHEKICEERLAIQERGESAQQDDIWSKPSSPTVESLLRLWEDLYIKNCGVLVAKRSNLHCFITNPALRVIYLTLFLARIHKCICVSNVIKYIWKSDWEGMNKALDVSVRDPVLVHEVASYALDTMNFWLDLMHASQDNPKLGILNTPIIATICVFCSILVLVEYLKWAEDWARKRTICKDASDNHNAFDKSIWLKCKRLIDRLEGYLTSKSNSAYHYVDNMHVGPFNGNSATSQITHSSHDHAATDGDNAAQMVLKAQISNTVPYLGIRLLTESYIWPIALDFAHALRARAMHNLPKQV